MKTKLMQGNEACVAGALKAGMKFFAGYPITPSTEIAELAALELPKVGGKFIQMEDEIASMAATIGASLTGLKSMTATSGPGFSLKQENLGYAAISEVPCVVVNVQRAGPSTGLPTLPAQGDLMQAKWGTHGDHPTIALYPWSVSEIYTTTIKAFNLAEKYRTPVILLLDEVIGHMREKLNLVDNKDITIIDRKMPECRPEDYKPYEVLDGELVPPMATFGTGYRYHVTGLIHDETGFPSNDGIVAENLVKRLLDKIENREDIIEYDEYLLEDADIAIVSFGAAARSSIASVDILRRQGYKVGLFRPITIWPSPEKKLNELKEKIDKFIVVEMNAGQYSLEIERIIGRINVSQYGRFNGELITPDEIVNFIKEVKDAQ